MNIQGTVDAITTALGEHDAYARAHCDRVVTLAMRIGRACALESRELEALRIAAQFHDVGMIGVHDDILTKQGKLNADEWVMVKTHPERGEQILRSTGLETSEVVAPIIRHHHEAYDGSGYPDGLKGEDIPMACRILLVVDAYDAMTTPRPYQKARTHEEALEVMRSEAGSKFDARVLIEFMDIIEREEV